MRNLRNNVASYLGFYSMVPLSGLLLGGVCSVTIDVANKADLHITLNPKP